MPVGTTPTEELRLPAELTRSTDTLHDPGSPSLAVRSFAQSRGALSRRAGLLSTAKTFGRKPGAGQPLRWRPDTVAPITRPPRGLPVRGGGSGASRVVVPTETSMSSGRPRRPVGFRPFVNFDGRATSRRSRWYRDSPGVPDGGGRSTLDRAIAGSIPAGAIAADVVSSCHHPIRSRSGFGCHSRRRRGCVAHPRGDPHRGRQHPSGAGLGRVCDRHGPVGIPGIPRSSPRDADAPR